MSNRFRKLKLTQTLRQGFSSNRLVPLTENASASLDSMIRIPSQTDIGNPRRPESATAWTTSSKDSGEETHTKHTQPVSICLSYYVLYYIVLIMEQSDQC